MPYEYRYDWLPCTQPGKLHTRRVYAITLLLMLFSILGQIGILSDFSTPLTTWENPVVMSCLRRSSSWLRVYVYHSHTETKDCRFVVA